MENLKWPDDYINRVINADCLLAMKEIPDKSIDMVLCDLPYGTTACSWDIVIPFEPLWEIYKRVIKDNGAIVLTASQPFTSKLIMSNIDMFRYEWIWEKSKGTGFMNSKKMPMKYHENILVFYKKLPTYNPQGLIKGKFNNSRNNFKNNNIYTGSGIQKNPKNTVSEYTNYPKSILKIENPSGKGMLHPTQKPIALFEYFIKTYTNPDNLVLDNCFGSGTTGIACLNVGRQFIGIELDKKYCKIAEARIKNETKQGELI
jgi:site-specific DNA-methyltransferase (adenine-specific)